MLYASDGNVSFKTHCMPAANCMLHAQYLPLVVEEKNLDTYRAGSSKKSHRTNEKHEVVERLLRIFFVNHMAVSPWELCSPPPLAAHRNGEELIICTRETSGNPGLNLTLQRCANPSLKEWESLDALVTEYVAQAEVSNLKDQHEG
jgi:hypothetical protein